MLFCLLPACLLAACGDNDAATRSAATDGAAGASAADAPENTYVADFDVGDLSFKRIWVPDVGQSGFDFKVWFDLTTKASKQKVYVTVDFVRLDVGNASDLDVAANDFETDHPKIPVGAFVIDQIDPGDAVHVEQTFTLPSNLDDGKYAAIFGINQIDVFPEVNAAQGEVAGEDPARVLVAPATVIVGRPTKPNLRVLTSSLSDNYFVKPAMDPAAPSAVPLRHIQVNLEVDSMALDCTENVDVAFQLSIAGHQYPLKIGTTENGTDSSEPGTSLRLVDRWTYEAGGVQIPPLPDDVETDEIPLHSTDPIAVATQIPIGRTFDLYLPDTAFDELSADATGEVIITIDPDNRIDEWGDSLAAQKGDNVKRHAIQFLEAPPEDTTVNKSACHSFPNASEQYANIVKNMEKSDSYGNSNFGVDYGIRGVMSGGDTSVKFGSYNHLNGKIFGIGFSVLDANAELDADMDCGAFYGYNVDVFGVRKFGGGAEFDPGATQTLWEGDYKVSKELEKSTTLMVGGIVPIDVIGGVTGTIGVVPRVSVGPRLKLAAEIAPYVKLEGMAEGGINLGVIRGGVGIELLVLNLVATNTLSVELPFTTPSYPDNPPYSALTISYQLPLEISTLDGRFYLWGDRRNWRWKWKRIGEFDVVNWQGLSWTYDIVPLQTRTFALVQP